MIQNIFGHDMLDGFLGEHGPLAVDVVDGRVYTISPTGEHLFELTEDRDGALSGWADRRCTFMPDPGELDRIGMEHISMLLFGLTRAEVAARQAG